MFRAAAAAVIAGGLGVAVWCAVASLTAPPSPVGAIVVGLAVGYGCGWAARGGGWRIAMISGPVAVAWLAVGFYYADRLAFIEVAHSQGRRLSLPLRPPPDWAWHVLREGFGRWVLQYPNAVVAVAAAVFLGANGAGHHAVAHRRAHRQIRRSRHRADL